MFAGANDRTAADQPEIEAAEHRQGRAAYIRAGGGTPPPGAAPIDP